MKEFEPYLLKRPQASSYHLFASQAEFERGYLLHQIPWQITVCTSLGRKHLMSAPGSRTLQEVDPVHVLLGGRVAPARTRNQPVAALVDQDSRGERLFGRGTVGLSHARYVYQKSSISCD